MRRICINLADKQSHFESLSEITDNHPSLLPDKCSGDMVCDLYYDEGFDRLDGIFKLEMDFWSYFPLPLLQKEYSNDSDRVPVEDIVDTITDLLRTTTTITTSPPPKDTLNIIPFYCKKDGDSIEGDTLEPETITHASDEVTDSVNRFETLLTYIERPEVPDRKPSYYPYISSDIKSRDVRGKHIDRLQPPVFLM